MRKINKGLRDNLQYSYDIDYDYDNDISNCDCYPDYCRCGIIINKRITSGIIPYQLVSNIYNEDEITQYCIDRVLTLLEIYDKECLEIRTEPGYYGEEIEGVYLEHPHIYETKIQELLNLKTDREKIEYVLRLEYGFILDSVENCNWNIITVNKDKIIFPQNAYQQKINTKALEIYKNYPFARGIVIPVDSTRFKVVDGYHRISSASNKFEVICGTKNEN